MTVVNDIKGMVLRGYVLDSSGRWVRLKEAVESSRDLVVRTSRGEVFDGKQWVPVSVHRRRIQSNQGGEGQRRLQTERSFSLRDERMWLRAEPIGKGITEIHLGGVIDQRNIHLLQQGLQRCIGEGYILLLVNFAEVRHISSAGWGLLSALLPGVRRRGGDVLVYQMRESVYEEFIGMQFDQVFNGCETRSDAYAHFERIAKEARGGTEVEQDNLTVEEKVKKMIAQMPGLSVRELRRKVQEIESEEKKIGMFAFRRMLREMDLETKEKRWRFSRSY